MENNNERKIGIFSVISLILGILAVVFEIGTFFGAPVLIFVVSAIASIITGVISICLKNKTTLSIIGIIFSAISIITGIAIFAFFLIYAISNPIDFLNHFGQANITNNVNITNEENSLNDMEDLNEIAINSNSINDNTVDDQSIGSELKVEKVSLNYNDSKWIRDTSQDKDNVKVIKGEFGLISLSYQTSNYYYTTTQAGDKLKKQYEDSGYNIVSDENITLNGTQWIKISFNKDIDNAGVHLIRADDYTIYHFIYTATDVTSYEAEIKDVEKVYKTLKFDNQEDKNDEQEAKNDLIGEWDWGKQGYFVIEENKIYLYQDSTKDKNNVFFGTYVADNKLKTYAAGYVDGYEVIMTIEEFYQNGEKLDTSSLSKFNYAFAPNADGTYTIKNLTNGLSGIAKKVK